MYDKQINNVSYLLVLLFSVLHRRAGGWCVPFPGADASVVYRTQRALYERHHRRPAHIKTYLRLPTLLYAIALIAFSAMVYLLARLRPTRALLLKYPGLFTMGFFAKEPSEAVVEATTFRFELFGEGWEAGADVDAVPPNKKMTVRVSLIVLILTQYINAEAVII